ncbi:MAG: M24 family metallopeptidase [Thermodesulfobacteriota bacterium]
MDFTPEKEVYDRIGLFQDRLRAHEIDYAIIIQNVNVYYFTGSIQKSYLIIPADQKPLFIVQKDPNRARTESPLPIIEMHSVKQLPDILSSHGLDENKRVGLELDFLSVAIFNKLKNIVGYSDYADISSEVLKLRARKSSYELEQIKKSGKICDHVFSKVADYLDQGISEVELSALLQAEGRRVGHQGIMRMRGLNQELTNPHVLSGPCGAVSSFGDVPLCGCGMTPAVAQGASRRKIEPNEPVIIDYGGGYNGYITDETRTYVLGNLDKTLQKAYALSLDILEYFQENACQGANGKLLFEQIESWVVKNRLDNNFMGYGPNRVSFVGHGIGLTLNELPVIAKNRDEILNTGMVIAVEPKFVFPGQGAVGVEADFMVRTDKSERVTGFTTTIQYV